MSVLAISQFFSYGIQIETFYPCHLGETQPIEYQCFEQINDGDAIVDDGDGKAETLMRREDGEAYAKGRRRRLCEDSAERPTDRRMNLWIIQ